MESLERYATALAYMANPIYMASNSNSTLASQMSEAFDDIDFNNTNMTSTLKLPSTFSKSLINFSAISVVYLPENDSTWTIVAPFYTNNSDSSYYFALYHGFDGYLTRPSIVKTVVNQYMQVLNLEDGMEKRFDNYHDSTTASISHSSGNFLSAIVASACTDRVADCITNVYDFKKNFWGAVVAGFATAATSGAGYLAYIGACYLKNCSGSRQYMWGRSYY